MNRTRPGRSTLTGHTTSRHRLSLYQKKQAESGFVQGLFKIFKLTSINHRLTAHAVGSTGLICVMPYTLDLFRSVYGRQRQPASMYFFNSLRPCLPLKGCMMPLKWIPVGEKVSNLGYYARSGGTAVQILRHRYNQTQCKLPSKKIIWIKSNLLALIGVNAWSKIKHNRLRKAGDLSRIGRRSRTRGVAMNPVDHPHGGGQGKTSGGRPGCTPWGKLTKGYKTRRTCKNRKNLKSPTGFNNLKT